MGFIFETIDHITELESEIHYIKRFISRIVGKEDGQALEFYIYFSLEYQPLGKPVVSIKFIDQPSQAVRDAEESIIGRIVEMEKSKELKHSPFTGL